MKLPWILAAISPLCVLAQSEDIPVVSVCEAIQYRELYHGKLIIVIGLAFPTPEGSWLAQDSCPFSSVSDIAIAAEAKTVPQPPAVPPGLQCDSDSIKAVVAAVQKTTKLRNRKIPGYPERWLAIFGRFETRLPFQRGVGFGHLSTSVAQIVEAGECAYPSTP